MKNRARQQEILLMIHSSLSRRTFCEMDAHGDRIFSAVEQLEEFCWDGNLKCFIPDVMEKNEAGKKLLLWHIQQARSFLHIDLCEMPTFSGEEYSIDPYFFISYTNFN